MNNIEAEWFAFQPGDIVLCQTGNEWGILKPLFKWLVGGWGHAMMFVIEVPNFDQNGGQLGGSAWFVEARPKKGVSMVLGNNYNSAHVMVLRVKDDNVYRILAANEALKRASDPSTLYDFYGIIACVIKLLAKKFGKKIQAWNPDKYTICSELVAECYATVGLQLELGPGIPLPSDFVNCPQLQKIFEGELVV